ncbi:MAG TPA: hypothetical protein DET40_01595 [Lentisphaeria bacterium]|nr:MAG: hypothetical protein A2X45_17125 [Lentisphaerae bacterium GWF2_50_93]HCE42227.1 hypothetical protein [Lentisphaeria bacterium]
MAKTDTILAIDIGADSIKLAEFSFPPGGKLVLEKFAFAEYGYNLREEEMLPALAEKLRYVISENNFKSRKVSMSISGQSTFIRFVKIPSLGENEDKIRQIVGYEAKQNVPFPINEVIWDHQLIHCGADSDIEVMFVVVKNTVVEELVALIEALGMEIDIIDVAPAACYNTARANEIGGAECVMLLNIGARCSSLVFIDKGRFFVRTIPIAGHMITQRLGNELGIPFEDAEELKRNHGFVALDGAYDGSDSDIEESISKITRNVKMRLYDELKRSIHVYKSREKGSKPVKLYISGGSSVIPFTLGFFSENLKMPVEYFNPFQVVSLPGHINKEQLAEVSHMFSEVIGLGLRHIRSCPIEISLIPEKVRKIQKFRSKTPYFYASAVSFVLGLLLLCSFLMKQEKIICMKVQKARQAVESKVELQEQVAGALNSRDAYMGELMEAKKLLSERCSWINILNEFQSKIPDNMWLVSICAGNGETAPKAKAEEEKGALSTIFQAAGSSNVATADPGKVEWIDFEGHFIGTSREFDIFKKSLLETTVFTDNPAEFITRMFEPPRDENNNFSSFKMSIRLKAPFNR